MIALMRSSFGYHLIICGLSYQFLSDWAFDDLRVRSAACIALNVCSMSVRRPSHADEQHMQSSIYTRRRLFGPQRENVGDIIRENRNGGVCYPERKSCKNPFTVRSVSQNMRCSAFTLSKIRELAKASSSVCQFKQAPKIPIILVSSTNILSGTRLDRTTASTGRVTSSECKNKTDVS